MARTIPATHQNPDPTATTAGQAITSSQMLDLGLSINRLHAAGRCGPVVSQCWAAGFFGDFAAALTKRCQWRIPQLSPAHTKVKCRVYADHDVAGVGGTVEFRSVNAGGTVTLPIAAGASAWYESDGAGIPHLPITFGPGYETVEMYTNGDGANYTHVHTVSVSYLGLTGTLLPGLSGSFVPEDDNEFQVDEPVSSDMLEIVRANLLVLEQRPRMVINWSAANGITGAGYDLSTLQAAYHRIWTRLNQDQDNVFTYHTLVGDPAIDETLYIQHGPGDAYHDDAWQTEVTVAAAGGNPVWVSGTLMARDFTSIPNAPFHCGPLDFATRGGAGVARNVFSVAVWGP